MGNYQILNRFIFNLIPEKIEDMKILDRVENRGYNITIINLIHLFITIKLLSKIQRCILIKVPALKKIIEAKVKYNLNMNCIGGYY